MRGGARHRKREGETNAAPTHLGRLGLVRLLPLLGGLVAQGCISAHHQVGLADLAGRRGGELVGAAPEARAAGAATAAPVGTQRDKAASHSSARRP